MRFARRNFADRVGWRNKSVVKGRVHGMWINKCGKNLVGIGGVLLLGPF